MVIITLEPPRNLDATNRSLLINQIKQTKVQNPAHLFSTFQPSLFILPIRLNCCTKVVGLFRNSKPVPNFPLTFL